MPERNACAPEIILVTGGARMPVADTESWLLVDALAARGVRVCLAAWETPRDWAATPLVVLRTPWDYVERHEQFLAWARATAAVTMLVNPLAIVEWNMHKRYLAELAASGVPVVPLALVARGADSAEQDAARTAFGEQIVIKPAISGGAFGTIRTRASSAQAREHLARLLSDGDALVQPYLPTIEAGEVSLVFFAGELSHAARRRPAAGDFRVQHEHGGSVAPHRATPAELAVAQAVLDAVGPTTYARIDVLTTPAGPLLMEAELIEPELYLTVDPEAAPRLADVLIELRRSHPATI